MTDLVLELFKQFGAPGGMLAFLFWDRVQQNKLTKERAEADLEVAKALTLVAERVR